MAWLFASFLAQIIDLYFRLILLRARQKDFNFAAFAALRLHDIGILYPVSLRDRANKPWNTWPTVLHRFRGVFCLFWHYVGGECPYLPPKPISLSFQIIFFIFPSVSKIIIYIFWKFFLKKLVYCLLYFLFYSLLLHVGAMPMLIPNSLFMPSKWSMFAIVSNIIAHNCWISVEFAHF